MPVTAVGHRRHRPLLLALVYVVPLGLAVAGLAAIGDRAIALALVLVEIGVIGSIRLVGRRGRSPARPVRQPGEPVLGLPGDRRTAGGRAGAVAALALVGIVVVLGIAVALVSTAG